MSDLRDQTFVPSEPGGEFIPTSPILNRAPVVIEEPILARRDGEEELGQYHVIEDEEPGSNTAKIVGGVAVALLVGAAVVFGYEMTAGKPNQATLSQTAANNPGSAVAPVTPPPAPEAAATTPDATPASAPAAQTPAPVRSAALHRSRSSHSARVEAPVSSESAAADTAATPVQPVSPQAPASSLAANPNAQQSPSAETTPAVPESQPAQAPQAAPAQPDAATPNQTAPQQQQ